MNPDVRQQIAQLHKIYVERTGLDLRLDIARERSWYEFIGLGFTTEDLNLVIDHIRRGIRENRRNPGALKFRNLICMLDYFEEDLAEAKAAKRPPQPSTRTVQTAAPTPAGVQTTERVMPSDGTENRTRSAADVMANLAELKKVVE